MEPLAVAAARKGYGFEVTPPDSVDDTWLIWIEDGMEYFLESTYADAEAAARKYLESLPDKEK